MGQSFLIYQTSPRGVDEERTLTHLRDTQTTQVNTDKQRYSQPQQASQIMRLIQS